MKIQNCQTRLFVNRSKESITKRPELLYLSDTVMQEEPKNAAEHCLDNSTDPSVINEERVVISDSMSRSLRNKDIMDSVVLQGNQCYFKKAEKGNKGKEKKQKKSDEVPVIPKRVTFKPIEVENDTEEDDGECQGIEDPDKDVEFRLKRQTTAEERLKLARNMNRHLLGVYQRKIFEKTQSFVYENQRKKLTINQANGCKTTIEASPEKQPDSQPQCSPSDERRRVSHRHPRDFIRPALNRTTMSTQKPLIEGLVVDSVSNQKPSIVRASKNANIREEFALQQKLSGYNKSCIHTINTIKIAQRHLSTKLQKLRSKMAQKKMDEKQLSAFRNSSDQLFLRNKGYMPTSKDSLGYLCFPPLQYQKRRVLSCH